MDRERMRLYAVHHTLQETRAAMREVTAARADAPAMAKGHHEAMLGRVIEVDFIEISHDGRSMEYHAAPGHPYVVEVQPTDPDNLRLCTGTHLDPRWDVRVIDGRGEIDMAAAATGWTWIFGPAIAYTTGKKARAA